MTKAEKHQELLSRTQSFFDSKEAMWKRLDAAADAKRREQEKKESN